MKTSSDLVSEQMLAEHPRHLFRQGREYNLVARAEDGSALYEASRGWGSDFWIRRADGSKRPWNYRTLFGRRRPLEPELGQWEWLRE